MRKHTLLVVSILILASMQLSACAKKLECTDSIGCVTVAEGEPIHIAYAMVITGSDATLGTDSRNGVEIAIDDKGGKLLGHDIKFDGEDDQCSAEGGQAAGTKLAADPTIVAVIGTSCSSALRVAMPLWSAAGFTVISASNTSVDLTLAGNENQHPGYRGGAAHQAGEPAGLVAEGVEEGVDDQKAVAGSQPDVFAPDLEHAQVLRVRRHHSLGPSGGRR